MYDPDRFDCEILIERSGHTRFTVEAVAELLGISKDGVRTRLSRGFYERPAVYDAYKGAGLTDGLQHEWSKEQMIDMMLKGTPRECKRMPLVHGTTSGYNLHRNRKIPMCDRCRKAYNKQRHERAYA